MSRAPKYLKATEASKLLDITITEFLDAVKSGRIPKPYFMGQGYRWMQEELEEWKNKQRWT